MELITYTEAMDILGGKIDTIRHAVSRGDLTRAGRQKRNIYLIKEQVELFKGRKLSRESLNGANKALWYKYEQEASQSQALGAAVVDDEMLMQRIKQALLEQQAEQAEQEAERARQRAIKAREEKERFHEGHPFLMRVKARDLVRA